MNGVLMTIADLDVYRFEATAGDRIAFLVHAARLQHPVPQLERDFSDIVVTLHDAAGAELASADDSLTGRPRSSPTLFSGPAYFYLRLREARYHSGKDKWWYALSVFKQTRLSDRCSPRLSGRAKRSTEIRRIQRRWHTGPGSPDPGPMQKRQR